MSRFAYGPVASRRFGWSLGVDVVPLKVCSYDCVFCQLGPTTRRSWERESFCSVDDALADVRAALDRGPQPDIITFAGSGEPTLHKDLGALASAIRTITPLPLLLITNGSLLWRDDVAADAAQFDWIAPSLSAGDEATFAAINGPGSPVPLDTVIDGLARFVAAHRDRVFLEVFFMQGINDREPALTALIDAVRRVNPVRVDLNTATRPAPGRPGPAGVSPEFLARVAARFPCPAVPIPDFGRTAASGTGAGPEAEAPATIPSLALRASFYRPSSIVPPAEICSLLLSSLSRRPATALELALALGLPRAVVDDALADLQDSGTIRREDRGGRIYFFAV